MGFKATDAAWGGTPAQTSTPQTQAPAVSSPSFKAADSAWNPQPLTAQAQQQATGITASPQTAQAPPTQQPSELPGTPQDNGTAFRMNQLQPMTSTPFQMPAAPKPLDMQPTMRSIAGMPQQLQSSMPPELLKSPVDFGSIAKNWLIRPGDEPQAPQPVTQPYDPKAGLFGNVQRTWNNIPASFQGQMKNLQQGLPAMATGMSERINESLIPSGEPMPKPTDMASAMRYELADPWTRSGMRPPLDWRDMQFMGHAATAGLGDLANRYSPVGYSPEKGIYPRLAEVANTLVTDPVGTGVDAALAAAPGAKALGAAGKALAGTKLYGRISQSALANTIRAQPLVHGLGQALKNLHIPYLARMKAQQKLNSAMRTMDAESQYNLMKWHKRLDEAYAKVPPAEQQQLAGMAEMTQDISTESMSPEAKDYLKIREEFIQEMGGVLEGKNALGIKIMTHAEKLASKWGPLMMDLAKQDGEEIRAEDLLTAKGKLSQKGAYLLERARAHANAFNRQPQYNPHMFEKGAQRELATLSNSSQMIELQKRIKWLNAHAEHRAREYLTEENSLTNPFSPRKSGEYLSGMTRDVNLSIKAKSIQVERIKLYTQLIRTAEDLAAEGKGAGLVPFPLRQSIKDAYQAIHPGTQLYPQALDTVAETIMLPGYAAKKMRQIFNNDWVDEFTETRLGRGWQALNARMIRTSLGLNPKWPLWQWMQQYLFNQMGMWKGLSPKELTASVAANMLANNDKAEEILKSFEYSHIPTTPDAELFGDPLLADLANKGKSLKDRYIEFEHAVTQPIFNLTNKLDNIERRRRAAYLLIRETLESPGAANRVMKKGLNLNALLDEMGTAEKNLTSAKRMELTVKINDWLGDYSKLARYEQRGLQLAFPYFPWLRHLGNVLKASVKDAPLKTGYSLHTAQALQPELQPAGMSEENKNRGAVYRRTPTGDIGIDKSTGAKQIYANDYLQTTPFNQGVNLASQIGSAVSGSGESPEGGQAMAAPLRIAALANGLDPNNPRRQFYESEFKPGFKERSWRDIGTSIAQGTMPLPFRLAADSAIYGMGNGMQGTSGSFNFHGIPGMPHSLQVNPRMGANNLPVKYNNFGEFIGREALGTLYMDEKRTAANEALSKLQEQKDKLKYRVRHPAIQW